MHTRLPSPFPVFLVASLFRVAVPVSPLASQSPEVAIARRVDAHNAASIGLLERIVNINSGTMNFPGVRAVADVLRAQFDSLGFTTRWDDGSPFHRAGHLVAEHKGPGPKILLIGHLDTVFEPTNPFQRWELQSDSMAHGPGVIDMKGGDVIILAALRALKEAGQLDRMNVVVVYDGDEEDAGRPLRLARQTIEDAARGAQYAIGFEDGAADPKTAVISRRSAGSWNLVTTGVEAHSSQIFSAPVGAGAAYEASRILTGFYTSLSKEPYLTFNPGLIVAGTQVATDSDGSNGTAAGKRNVVAQRATVTGDLRTLSPEQLAKARSTMEAIVAKHLPHTTAAITFDDGYPPMAPTAGNKRLLSLYSRASSDLGFGPVIAVDPSRAGAADVAFVASEVPMAIDGIGLSGHDDHSEKETGDLKMFGPLTKRAALLLYRLTAAPIP